MVRSNKKILIIRLSSFGDIVQCMGTLGKLKEANPGCEIHWVVKSEFSGIVSLSKNVDKLWEFDKKSGIIGWIKLALTLRGEGFTHLYDAHSNPRSHIMAIILRCLTNLKFIRRPKNRVKRVLLFKFSKNYLPWPFKGALSYLNPIKTWLNYKGKETEPLDHWQFPNSCLTNVERIIPEKLFDYIAIAPSAAWELKRWPVDNWKKLVEKLSDEKFLVLGGPTDSFCQDIADVDPKRIINLAGKTSLVESCYIVSEVKSIVSGDTGILHVADILQKKTIALIGPSAFGFPSSNQARTIEIDLHCRPCTKDGSSGKCSNVIYKKCMLDITVDSVIAELQ